MSFNLSLSVSKVVLPSRKPDPQDSQSELGKWVVFLSLLENVVFKNIPEVTIF